MQNNTNALNELLQVANELPDASSGGNPTQDFFIDYTGIYSIDLNGGLTKLNINDLPGDADDMFMEWCRNDLFHMGGVNASSYPDSANPGRQGARGRFLFSEFDTSNYPNLYMYFHDHVVEVSNIDSMIVECIGGPGTSIAECTMIADIYTVDAQHYHLQICCKEGAYNTDGWAPVPSGGSSRLTLFSTWTGETGEGGLLMSQNCVNSKLYLVHLGYSVPDDENILLFGQGIFRASSEPYKYSWARIEFQRSDDASVSTIYETLYATWLPSLSGPAEIYITGFNKLSSANVVMCNLYQLN